MKVFISAAEASSDTHGAALVQALRKEYSVQNPTGRLRIFGIGGPRLKAEGTEILAPASDLLAMGFVEVFSRISRILSILKDMGKAAATEKPDLAILIDYPDFHFKLAKELNTQGVPVICMIPPKIWAWRKNRIHKIAKLYRHVFSIFPFEEKIYRDAHVPFTYLGNPLLDELPLTLSRSEARKRVGVDEDAKVLLLMPGSRPSEIKYHLTPMLEAAEEVAKLQKMPLHVLMPLAPTDDLEKVRNLLPKTSFEVILSQGNAWECMVAADAGIIKSGTSTLEAAVLNCPHVVIYDGHPVSKFLYRHLLRYTRPISLVNLVEGHYDRKIVQELILENFQVSKMVEEVMPLLDLQSPLRSDMIQKFAGVRKSLEPPDGATKSPSEKAAKEILALVKKWKTQ